MESLQRTTATKTNTHNYGKFRFHKIHSTIEQNHRVVDRIIKIFKINNIVQAYFSILYRPLLRSA